MVESNNLFSGDETVECFLSRFIFISFIVLFFGSQPAAGFWGLRVFTWNMKKCVKSVLKVC